MRKIICLAKKKYRFPPYWTPGWAPELLNQAAAVQYGAALFI
jgi:hypothetical protein